MLTYEGLEGVSVSSVQVRASPTTRTRSWPFGDDRPQADQALLWDGLRDLSDRLTTVIERSAPSAPILVTGDWGSGKSSLLAATRNRLDGRQYLTVWFGAWSYEGEGPLLPL